MRTWEKEWVLLPLLHNLLCPFWPPLCLQIIQNRLTVHQALCRLSIEAFNCDHCIEGFPVKETAVQSKTVILILNDSRLCFHIGLQELVSPWKKIPNIPLDT